MITARPMSALLIRAVAASALVAGLAGLRAEAQAPDARPAPPTNTDGAFAAYVAGDQTAIDRLFKTSLDFQNRLKLYEPKEFDRWLGEYDQAKAVFVLSLARASAVTARQYTPILLLAGERYVDGGPGLSRNTRPGADPYVEIMNLGVFGGIAELDTSQFNLATEAFFCQTPPALA